MLDRPVLCVVPNGAPARDCECINGMGSWQVHVVTDLAAADRMLRAQRFQVGLLWLPHIDERLSVQVDSFLHAHAEPEWIGVFDADDLTRPAGRELVLEHLFDHHTLPLDADRLLITLGHAWGHAALRYAAHGEGAEVSHGSIVGRSDATLQLLQQIRRVAKVDAPVLIRGESGTGKELAAQAIHEASARAAGPFVPVNCGAIPPSLIQSVLFGHAKGAFTGANRDSRGLIEAASGGTLLLDEIGDLPLELQINLLRFLQESTINRVGSTQSVRVDVRVIAATHVDIDTAVAAGAFREDLYYRLNVLPLQVPPLRERRDDIEPLARHFYAQFEREKSPKVRGFSRRAIAAMEAHAWHGNVRELINRVRRAMVMAEGRLIAPADLGLVDADDDEPPHDALDEARIQAERSAIAVSLQHAGRNVTQAARRLGVSRMTLYRLMAKHGINP